MKKYKNILFCKERNLLNIKNLFKILSILALFICTSIMVCGITVYYKFPDEYKSTSENSFSFESVLPITAKTEINKDLVETESNIHKCKRCSANIRLLNVIPIKNVNVNLVEEKELIPCGTPFGVKIFTQGVMIIGLSDIKTDDGVFNPAKSAGIKKGDIILNINGKEVLSNEDILKIVEESNGQSINLNIRRSNLVFEVNLSPVKSSSDQMYKIGLWVRDSSAGIGTMTFFDPASNCFAGLGHGICDIDTGELLPLSHGDIMKASINGVIKGEKGSPGELKGAFSNNEVIGNLRSNSFAGVYGELKCCPIQNELLPIAMKQQVKIGKAKILTTISSDTPRYYNIEITSINYNENAPSKNMVILITDEELIETTGGIVQGMSGSPIIQNGKIVAAVTHVFVNEPTKGYAIFIENMLSFSNSLYSAEQKKIS